jgi:hypothetical protein
MGTTSRAAAVVHQYGHFRRPDGFRFSQLSPAGAWMLEAPTIYAAVVHQYGHFRRPDGFRFSQLSPAGAWMLAAPTIYAAARSPHGTTSDCTILQSSSAKKVVRHCEFSEKFEILEK